MGLSFFQGVEGPGNAHTPCQKWPIPTCMANMPGPPRCVWEYTVLMMVPILYPVGAVPILQDQTCPKCNQMVLNDATWPTDMPQTAIV